MKIEKWDEINGIGTHNDRLEAFLESKECILGISILW